MKMSRFQLEQDYHLVIVRLYRSIGVVDWPSAQTIRNARAAGFQRIEGYFLPCRTCDEPFEQVRRKNMKSDCLIFLSFDRR